MKKIFLNVNKCWYFYYLYMYVIKILFNLVFIVWKNSVCVYILGSVEIKVLKVMFLFGDVIVFLK